MGFEGLAMRYVLIGVVVLAGYFLVRQAQTILSTNLMERDRRWDAQRRRMLAERRRAERDAAGAPEVVVDEAAVSELREKVGASPAQFPKAS